MARAERILRAHLYVRPSQLRRYNRLSRNYSFEIGNGLFTTRTIPKDTHIVDFVSEYLNNVAEIQRRRMHSDTGGYLLGNTTGTFCNRLF